MYHFLLKRKAYQSSGQSYGKGWISWGWLYLCDHGRLLACWRARLIRTTPARPCSISVGHENSGRLCESLNLHNLHFLKNWTEQFYNVYMFIGALCGFEVWAVRRLRNENLCRISRQWVPPPVRHADVCGLGSWLFETWWLQLGSSRIWRRCDVLTNQIKFYIPVIFCLGLQIILLFSFSWTKLDAQ